MNNSSLTSKYFSTTSIPVDNVSSKPASDFQKAFIRTCSSATNLNEQKQVSVNKKIKKQKLSGAFNAHDILQLSYVDNKTPTHGLNRLKYDFYDVPCQDLAKQLLGQILVRRLDDGRLLKGRIVETECYLGGEDKASHSYNGKITERTKPMYMKPGTMYVYFTYGMYHCFNISCEGPGAVVLLRAVEPLEGLQYMREEREKGKKNTTSPTKKIKELKVQDLCSGPGKLCISFNITKLSTNEKDLTTWDGMWIEEDKSNEKSISHIVTSHRIGIDSVGFEWASKPLRFYLLGNSSVSRRDKVQEKEVQEMLKYISK